MVVSNLHRQLVVSFHWTLSTILSSTGQNKCYGNILLYETAVFTVKMADHFGNNRCHIENNGFIAFILPGRWQDGVKSLKIETTSCLCNLNDS